MKRNTGYKVATKILLKKTVNGVESQELYAIGRYNNGVFESVGAEEIAGLSNEDYDRCVSDTKQYINSKAGIENIDDIFTNESRSEDLEMCPLPQKENIISVTVEPTADGQYWNFIFTSSYPVAAPDLQVFLKTGRYGTNNMFIKGQDRVNDPSIPKNLSGETATFRLELNGQSGTEVKDDFYVYKIVESIVMPVETEPEVPEEVQEILRATTTAIDVAFTVRHTNDITVDWGDGTVERNSFSHAYSAGGVTGQTHNIVFKGKPSDITYFVCSGSQLTRLDVSGSPKLEDLRCGENQLTSLDVSHNPELSILHCYVNGLTSLDLSHNRKLTKLHCHSNELQNLDLSVCSELIYLNFGHNQIAAIDLSSNLKLEDLNFEDNKLSRLDVSHNPNLWFLRCNGNPLASDNTSLLSLANTLPDRTGRTIGTMFVDIDASNEVMSVLANKNWTIS